MRQHREALELELGGPVRPKALPLRDGIGDRGIDAQPRPLPHCVRTGAVVQWRPVPQRVLDAFEELDDLEEPITTTKVVREVGWSLSWTRSRLAEFAKYRLLRAEPRGHFRETNGPHLARSGTK